MKKIIITTFIFLLYSFPSFGELKGKGLICELSDSVLVKKDWNERRVKGYYFGDNNILNIFFFHETGDKLFLSYKTTKYRNSEKTIKWYHKFGIDFYLVGNFQDETDMYRLNKKTLKLKRLVNYKSPSMIIEDLSCKLLENLDENRSEFYNKIKDEYFEKYQSELDTFIKNSNT